MKKKLKLELEKNKQIVKLSSQQIEKFLLGDNLDP